MHMPRRIRAPYAIIRKSQQASYDYAGRLGYGFEYMNGLWCMANRKKVATKIRELRREFGFRGFRWVAKAPSVCGFASEL